MAKASGPRSSDELREEAHALVNSVEDYAIFVLDAHGVVHSWNEGARKIKGYEESEIIGQSFTRFYTDEDRAAGKPQRLLSEAAQHGRACDQGWRVRKDGRRFWAEVAITALRNGEGPVRGFLKVTRDVTERREAEEKVQRSEQQKRLLLDSIKDYAIFMLDREGRITSWNAGAERTKGYHADEVIGRHIALFYTPDDVQQ